MGLVGWPLRGSVREDATCEADGNEYPLVLFGGLLMSLSTVLATGDLDSVVAARSLENCRAAAALPLVSLTFGGCGCGQDELGVADVEELLAIETSCGRTSMKRYLVGYVALVGRWPSHNLLAFSLQCWKVLTESRRMSSHGTFLSVDVWRGQIVFFFVLLLHKSKLIENVSFYYCNGPLLVQVDQS